MRVNKKPDFITGRILKQIYDGKSDDLLTAGLGKDGLASAQAPTFQDPENPSVAELRRLAVYSNYRAIIDTSPGSGYGYLYGITEGEGKIPGKEYLAYSDEGTGKQKVTLMIQIPDAFDPKKACIVTAPSSGSRGIYGAVGTAGEWGLKRGFAVAYTDKGTGTGVHDLDSNTVNRISGELADADTAGKDSHFTSDADKQFIKNHPHRLAFKHAHSQQNPEKDWGKNMLQAVKFAFYVLNLEENFGKRTDSGEVLQTLSPDNTIVIASGISNGGGASLRAAEQDTEHLIHGIAVSEPNVCPREEKSLIIQQGDKEWAYPNHSRSLSDCCTLLNLYQPCANLAAELGTPADGFAGTIRCAYLKDIGLLKSDTVEAQAREAQEIINAYGMLTEQNRIQPFHCNSGIAESLAVTYTNAYGRFSVMDMLCGYSFAAIDIETKKPTVMTRGRLAALFAIGNGIPPTGTVTLFRENFQDRSLSASGISNRNLESALCLRSLVFGKDASGNPLTGSARERHERVMKGIAEIRCSGNLHGLPAIIVHGRNDAILPPNHTSRAYYGLNQMTEAEESHLHYYEVLNAHHLDALNALPGFNSAYIPLHYYYIQALDLMYDHLRNGKALPLSQVIRTIPRGMKEDGTVPALAAANLPSISPDPADDNRIEFVNATRLAIPE